MTISIFTCGGPKPVCESCGRRAIDSCNYQVKRAGKVEACGKRFCASCRVSMPIGMVCLAHGRVMGPVLLERALHLRFSTLWVHGEWFRLEGDLAELTRMATR